MAVEVGKREPEVALALVRRVVDRDHQALAVVATPRPGDEAIPRPVTLPGRAALEEHPLAVTQCWLEQNGQQHFVKTGQPAR